MGSHVSRYNNIYFNGVDAVQWKEKEYCVTDGQPYKGSKAQNDQILVKAGRKGSTQCATEFNGNMQVVNMIASKSGHPNSEIKPRMLNFAVVGDAVFTLAGKQYECKDLRLGQGHFGSHNNWWIGAPNCFGSSISKGSLTCLATEGSSAYFDNCGLTFYSTGNSDHFFVKNLGPMPGDLAAEEYAMVAEPSTSNNVFLMPVAAVATALAASFMVGFAFGKWRNKSRFPDESTSSV